MNNAMNNPDLPGVEVRILKPRPNDFGDMLEAFVAVFYYLVLWSWNPNLHRPLKATAIAEFLGLHPKTVGDAIRDLQERGYIELSVRGQPAELAPPS